MKIRPVTIILCVLLIGAMVAIALIAPDTMEAKRILHIEQAATPTPTADVRSMLQVTIDPNNTPTPTPLLLKLGAQNDEVRRLQQRLKDLGFYTGEVDGQYGPGTQASVILFQEQHGLTADGIAGEGTRTRLYSQNAQTFIPTPTPAPTAASLLKSGGRVSRIEAPSLPIGILRETGFATHSDTLTDGDILLMMSDGVLDQGIAWVEEYLRDDEGLTAQQLADSLLEQACRRAEEGGHADDMTVAVLCLHRNTASGGVS